MHKVQPACTKSSQHAQSPASMHRVQPACRKSSKHERRTGGQVQVRIVDSTSQWFRVPYDVFAQQKWRYSRKMLHFKASPPRPVSGHPTDRRSSFPAGHGPSTKLVGMPPAKKSSLGSVLGQRRSNLRDGWMDGGRFCCRALNNKQHSL